MDCFDAQGYYEETGYGDPAAAAAPEVGDGVAPPGGGPVTWAIVGPGSEDELLAVTALGLNGELPASGVPDTFAPGFETYGEWPTADPNVIEVGPQ